MSRRAEQSSAPGRRDSLRRAHSVRLIPGYAPGARVEFAVHNQSEVEYVWNPCLRTLERLGTAGWVAVDEGGERVCTLEGWLLRPDQRTDATTGFAASLPPGHYRLRYGFWRAVGESTVADYQVSNSFRVMP